MPRVPHDLARTTVRLPLPGILLCAALACAGAAPPAGFEQGNALYASGKYAEAAAAYENAVQAGTDSANLFYDLGNAYERLGQRGRAVLNYRRALLLDPAHAEAGSNLGFVQGHSSGQGGSGFAWLASRLGVVNADFWPLLAAGSGWLGLTCLALGASGGRPAGRRLALAVFCVTVCALASGATWWLGDGVKNADASIVVAEPCRALYGPADNSKVITRLPLGSEVRVLSAQGAWVYARLADGTNAWLSAASVEKIVPPLPTDR